MFSASFCSFLKFFLFILSSRLLEKSGDLSSKEKDCDISQVSHLLFFWFWLKTMPRLMLGGNGIWSEFWGETCSHISRRIIKNHTLKKKIFLTVWVSAAHIKTQKEIMTAHTQKRTLKGDERRETSPQYSSTMPALEPSQMSSSPTSLDFPEQVCCLTPLTRSGWEIPN